jgi:hypothetical protein
MPCDLMFLWYVVGIFIAPSPPATEDDVSVSIVEFFSWTFLVAVLGPAWLIYYVVAWYQKNKLSIVFIDKVVVKNRKKQNEG